MARNNPVDYPTYVTNTKVQSSFVGGLDTLSSDTQIADNAYLWLINARDRYGYVDPIKRHQQLVGVPAGKKQGIVAVGDVLILFIAGFAYYQKDGTTSWIQIPNFSMDKTADRYWSCAVPASSFNFYRKSNVDAKSPVTVPNNFKISGTPASIVVQDGINQPFLILQNDDGSLTARVSKTFAEWANVSLTLDDREYVPIGREMILFNGNTLFIVAPDRKSVYRSVTGRPLDFMINVDSNGNKAATESSGGASTTSFACDFNEITCLYSINIPDSFIYGTLYNVRILVADYTNTIFGEPTFRVSASIEAGIINQRSIVEITGDYAFIDVEGVIAFNAVQQLKFNGRNSIFSLQLAKILKNIKQTKSLCINFDNYTLFSLDTTWGNMIVVYDILLQKWVAFDITDVIDIKEFALVETPDKTKLYCITEFDEVFQMFSNTSQTYLAQMKTKSFVAGQTDTEHRSQNLRLLFNGATFDGNVTAIEYVDEQSINDKLSGNQVNRVTKPLKASIAGVLYPVRPPVIPSSISRTDNPNFNFSKGILGKKLSYIIQWDNDARLIELQLTTSWKKSVSSIKETNQIMENTYGTNS